MPTEPLPPVRFLLDVPGEGQLRALRRLAGFGSVLAGLWLAVVADGWSLRVCGLVSAAVGLAWALTAPARRAGPGADAPGPGYLEVGPAGIELSEGGRQERLAWTELRRAVLDEDRLAVRLERLEGPPLVLEPHYENVGVYEIFEAICAHGAAAGLAGCTRGSDD